MRPDQVDQVIDWVGLTRPPSDSYFKPLVTVDTLSKIREEGYAAIGWGRHNLTPGKTSSVAVPIYRDGQFEAALTVIYFASSMKQEEAVDRYLADLQATAASISAETEFAECSEDEHEFAN
jgi:IclR family mhp operon transcriptional activator